MDPLLALRDAIRVAPTHPITYTDASSSPTPSLTHPTTTTLLLPPTNAPFPRDTPTRLRGIRLDAVLLAWLAKDASAADYIRQTREAGIPAGAAVGTTERRAVAEWLEGRGGDGGLRGLVPIDGDVSASSSTIAAATTTATTTTAVPTADAGKPAQPVSPSKRRLGVDTSDAEVVKRIRANEVELVDRTSVLRGAKPGNFASVGALYAERLKALKDAAKTGGAGGVPAPTAGPKIDPKMHARKARNMHPIIMISSSPTSLITMYNVRRFLQESVFEPPAEARARAAAEGNPKPEDVLPIYRDSASSGGSLSASSAGATGTGAGPKDANPTLTSSKIATSHGGTRYYVVDGVEALAKFGGGGGGGAGAGGGGATGGGGVDGAWDRVVAVLTTGQAWQFKPYRWTEPKTLFHHVKGFYVSWANDPPNAKIKDWNVTELKIDPHRRHVDKSVVANFWKTLDAWTLANKPWLIKS